LAAILQIKEDTMANKTTILCAFAFFVLVVGLHNESYALHQKKNPKPHGNKTSCEADLNICNTDLDSCQTDLVTCQASVCNNGVAEFGEECDGANLQGATCTTEGFQFGKLACSAICTLDASGCTNDRFVDNGDGSITDNQTGLMWHNKLVFNIEWTAEGFQQVPNGPVFITYLAGLNDAESPDGMSTPGCFLNHCDWRLPTIVELKTLQTEPFPCATPCIAPIFDPLWQNAINCPHERRFIWSSITLDPAIGSSDVWGIDFCDGELRADPSRSRFDHHAIAVRK